MSHIRSALIVNLVIHSCSASPFPTLSPVEECQALLETIRPRNIRRMLMDRGTARLEVELAGMWSMICCFIAHRLFCF